MHTRNQTIRVSSLLRRSGFISFITENRPATRPFILLTQCSYLYAILSYAVKNGTYHFLNVSFIRCHSQDSCDERKPPYEWISFANKLKKKKRTATMSNRWACRKNWVTKVSMKRNYYSNLTKKIITLLIWAVAIMVANKTTIQILNVRLITRI